MKIDQATIEVLKNFSSIQTNFAATAGQPITTISNSKSLYVTCDAVQFPADLAVLDLRDLLSLISLCDQPYLDIRSDRIFIKDEASTKTISYFFADRSHLIIPKRAIDIESVDVSFTFTTEHQKLIARASNILGTERVRFIGEAGKPGISVLVGELNNPTANSFTFTIDETPSVDFTIVLELENFKFLALDYTAQFSKTRVAAFVGPGIKYLMGLEKSSKIGA